MRPNSERLRLIESLNSDPSVAQELLTYLDRAIARSVGETELNFPLPAESHVATWRQYRVEADRIGTFAALKNRLVQLQFPVRAGMSAGENYRAATRRGASTSGLPEATGLVLSQSERLQLAIHESLAGPIPVIVARGRADFVALLQALTKRNEPADVPDSLGAMIVSGYNNWDRVQQLKERWQAAHPEDFFGDDWRREFQTNVVPNKELYQDRFILLSDGPYSGVAARDLGLDEEDWQRKSVAIRLEHECTHYFTRRVFGSAQNHALDELIADYRGIIAATGRFRAEWFLRFMGLENFPNCRPTGRLAYYRGEPPLSDSAFAVLQALVKRAAENLERLHCERTDQRTSSEEQLRVAMALCQMTLDELATDDGTARLRSVIG